MVLKSLGLRNFGTIANWTGDGTQYKFHENSGFQNYLPKGITFIFLPIFLSLNLKKKTKKQFAITDPAL